jgi:dipeptidyl aminopeptidase/acylaminoacyl peptidase
MEKPWGRHGLAELEERGEVLVSEYERDREWSTTAWLNLKTGEQKTVFSLSLDDDYNNPGEWIVKRNRFGEFVVAQEGRHAYLAGAGASPQGDRPFLRKISLDTLQTSEIHRSGTEAHERFASFLDGAFSRFLTVYETPSTSPRVRLRSVGPSTAPRELYADPNPFQIFQGLRKEVLTYARKDGVKLSATLYYPLGFQEGRQYPAVIQAYPMEYTDAQTAGQVRAAPTRFSRPFRDSILYLLMRGYFVLDDAQMPVVGHPETKNDTFVKQLTLGAEAAVEVLRKTGHVDIQRLGVMGHSYGAFMVSHLLTHTSLFRAGVAMSGAYNRTLTPFGFQGERRPLWKAKSTYLNMSSFLDADKVKTPLLLIHGAADNNPGTFTLQSERYYEALKGQGATVRLVLLPEESHGYSARESVGHVLVERERWFDEFLQPSMGRGLNQEPKSTGPNPKKSVESKE